MPLKLSLPEWLPPALLAKILISGGIILGAIVWWRIDRAKAWEDGNKAGIVNGEQRMEKLYKPLWEKTEKAIAEQTALIESEREFSQESLRKILTNQKSVLAEVQQIRLSWQQQRETNRETADAVPADKLDGAIRAVSGEIDDILANRDRTDAGPQPPPDR